MNDAKRMYLRSLVYGTISEERTISGFVKYYVLEGQALADLQFDVAMTYWPVAAGEAAKKVMKELEKLAKHEDDAFAPAPDRMMSFAQMLGDGALVVEAGPGD